LTDFLAELRLFGRPGRADAGVLMNPVLGYGLSLYNIHKLFTFLLSAYFNQFYISILGLIRFVNKIVDFFFIQTCG